MPPPARGEPAQHAATVGSRGGSHLQRHAQPRAKLLGVEVARGIAACLVVFYHAARHVALGTGEKPLGSLTNFGHAGVDFFFVLSGFIILFAHFDDLGRPDRTGHYIARRFTRVYPVYWAVLAVILAIGLVARGVLPPPTELIRDILLLPYGEPTLGVAWTLQFEVMFYTLFIALILHRRIGTAVFAAWLVLIVAGLVVEFPDVFGRKLANAYCAQFFMGMGAALLLRRGSVPLPGWLLGLGIASFLAFGMLENLGYLDGYGTAARFTYGIPATMILIGIVALERAGRLRVSPLAASIGSASYAIYLMHLLAIGITWKVLEKLGITEIRPVEIVFAIVVAAGIAGGIIGHRLIERPLLAVARATMQRGSPPRIAERDRVSRA